MVASLTRSRTAWLVAAVAALAACSGDPFAVPGSSGRVGLQGGTRPAPGLVGTWRRQLVFFGEDGYVHSSETRWTFAASGDAVRYIVTTNYLLPAADTSVTTARWQLDGSRLTIEYIAPSPGTIVLDARVEGSSLFLAGQEYLRVE